jgi:hypothetical protein
MNYVKHYRKVKPGACELIAQVRSLACIRNIHKKNIREDRLSVHELEQLVLWMQNVKSIASQAKALPVVSKEGSENENS